MGVDYSADFGLGVQLKQVDIKRILAKNEEDDDVLEMFSEFEEKLPKKTYQKLLRRMY